MSDRRRVGAPLLQLFNFTKKEAPKRVVRETIIPKPSYNIPAVLLGGYLPSLTLGAACCALHGGSPGTIGARHGKECAGLRALPFCRRRPLSLAAFSTIPLAANYLTAIPLAAATITAAAADPSSFSLCRRCRGVSLCGC